MLPHEGRLPHVVLLPLSPTHVHWAALLPRCFSIGNLKGEGGVQRSSIPKLAHLVVSKEASMHECTLPFTRFVLVTPASEDGSS